MTTTKQYFRRNVKSIDNIITYNYKYLNGEFETGITYGISFPHEAESVKTDLIELNNNGVIPLSYDLGSNTQRCNIDGIMPKKLYNELENYIANNKLDIMLMGHRVGRGDDGYWGSAIRIKDNEVMCRANSQDIITCFIHDLVPHNVYDKLKEEYINFRLVDPVWNRKQYAIIELNYIIELLV